LAARRLIAQDTGVDVKDLHDSGLSVYNGNSR
jgi:hypothetical protein